MKKLVLIAIIFFATCITAFAQDFKTHKVKQGETIEDIAKQYLVTPFDIYALNPDAKKGLKVNTVLIIPTSKVKEEDLTTETKEIIGFRTHKTKRKETLYSISKEYDIEIDEIKKHNTFLYANNLRKGDKLKIPRYKTVVSKVTIDNSIKKYKVLPKEGKWRVAYKFGITVPQLEALNPNMNEVLQPGDELNVPNISNNEEKVIEENYNYYTVLKSEGYMALNRKLGLTKEQLETLNPELKESGLKLGMVLKVPSDVDTTISTNDVANTNLTSHLKNFNTKRIALMMPYRLNRIDIDSIADVKRAIRTDSRLSISLDFHAGMLYALDSAKRLGISTYLKVFDTRDHASEVAKILNSNDFSDYDAVIGPLMPDNFDRVASDLKRDNIPVISPFTTPKNLYDNVYQTVPSSDLLQKAMINYVKLDTLPKHIVIISDAKNKAVSSMIRSELAASKQIFSRKDKDGKDSNYILISDLDGVFKPGRNIVFLETSNEAFASNVISMLNGIHNDEQQIVLMTTNKNSAFEGENISNYHLSNLKFHYPSANKTFSSSTTNGFVNAYKRDHNGVEPNKYAVRGFDLTLDVLMRLASEEDLFDASGSEIETEYVENKFRYSKKLFGGYFNEAVYIVKYDDLTIVEAK
ncbi:LysM peptidoglycan-binding domain-containing protein [Gaetbulibacter jejuensis]|uniref:LysM peptidoglycan-binding domain-containing protein n=1 Tax=Gaetbulibacter jejuensis TaxID=584607 RepID=UPI003008A8B5